MVPTLMWSTSPVANGSLYSRLIALKPAAPAYASPWSLALSQKRATIYPSPSCLTADNILLSSMLEPVPALNSSLRFLTASDSDIAAARNVVEETARHMGRSLDTNGLKELLYRNSESPR